jgi:hypothetical protein
MPTPAGDAVGEAPLLGSYEELVVQAGLFRGRAALRFYLRELFAGVPLRGARVLDVGGGSGVFSFWAGLQGAAEVVCLDPEGAGGGADLTRLYGRLNAALGLDNVRMAAATIQEFAEPGPFDVLLLHNSVNHVDEDACTRLPGDPAARRAYARVFAKLAGLAAPDARLIVCDCARDNFFPRLGLASPLARAIEWHKHQPPEVWAELFGEAGFEAPRVRWTSPSSLGRPGKLLLGNRVMTFFTSSHFRLAMRRAGGRPS